MSIRRHTLQNLAGTMAPMLISFAIVPVYLHLIGPARYGVLTIVWLFLGYFGVFDLGLARTTSFHMSRLHDRPARDRADVFYTALGVNIVFGLIGSVVFWFAARQVFFHAFHLSGGMGAQIFAVWPWLTIAIPLATVTSVMVGSLHAREAFGAASSIGVFNTLMAQLLPLAVAFWHGPDLTWLIPAVVIGRMIGLLPFIVSVKRAIPLGQGGRFDLSQLRLLFGYGGWIFVSNLLDPILSAMDRMLVGSILGADAVAYYSVPFNLVAKISSLAVTLPASLFPRMTRQDAALSAKLAADSLITMAAILTPVIVGGILVMPLFLRLWVGADFGQKAAPVGMALLPGIWINSLGFIVYGQLQAANRPDLTAKFHLLELVPFLFILWIGLHLFGLVGAAVAWSLRVTMDSALLFAATRQGAPLLRLLPAVALIFAAFPLAPTAVVSWRDCFAIALLLLSAVWAIAVDPALRDFMKISVHRVFRPSSAG